ncbi:MAG: ABC transporter permease [Clostridia bacterium]|nr:ABC transporter permease [Clostridia bacterium]
MKKTRFTKSLPSPKALFLIALIGLCAVGFTILAPPFIKVQNLYSMVLNASMPAILALAMGIVITSGGFDLCIGHTAGFASLMCGYFLRSLEMGAVYAIIAALFLALLIGAINGLIVSKLGISSFIATLGMQFVLVGVRQWITSGDSYRANKEIRSIAQNDVGGISNLILISIAILLVIGFLMQKTKFGRKMHFVGSNIIASEYCGISIRRITFLSFLISGAISGVVGILQFSRLTSATINIGDGWLFNAMTIAVFSHVIFGRFMAQGILIVSLLVTMVTTGINMLGVSSAWTNFVLGIILLSALLGGKYSNHSRKKKEI